MTDEQTPPAIVPAPEAPGTPSTPSAVSEAPAAAPIVPPVGAAAKVPEPVAIPVETERAMLLGAMHHLVSDIESFGGAIEEHARAAVVAGEHDVHAALSRIVTLFGEFRNGLLSAGKTMPAKLETEAAGLVAKAKA
jgi:hypothetical protein